VTWGISLKTETATDEKKKDAQSTVQRSDKQDESSLDSSTSESKRFCVVLSKQKTTNILHHRIEFPCAICPSLLVDHFTYSLIKEAYLLIIVFIPTSLYLF